MNPRRLLHVLMAAMLMGAASFLTAPSTARADEGFPLEVRIGAVSAPRLDFADPAQVLEISGTLTNTSTATLADLVVHFWRLAVPITSTAQLDELTSDPPIGARITDLASIAEIDTLGPGERAQFSVKASVAQLTLDDTPLPRDGAVYLVGAQVRGAVSQGRATVGIDTFPITATRSAIPSSTLVALTAPPSWLPGGKFRDHSLAEDLDGRLDTLLAAAERPGIRAAIDPALYQAALALSRPHTVAGEEVAGNGVALRWVQRVDTLIKEGRVWRLPYGNPDLMRADASGLLQQTLAKSRAAGEGILTRLEDVVILDRASEQIVAQLGEFDTVIVRDATGADEGPPRIIGATRGSAAAVVDGAGLATLLSEDFLSPRPPLYVIDSVRGAEIDAELAPWRTVTEPTAVPEQPLSWEQTTTPAWQQVAEALAAAQTDATLETELTGSPTVGLDAMAATAWSADFRDEAEALAYVRAVSPAHLDLKKVTLRAAGSFVMASSTNTFPLTLTNDLAVPVTLGVDFRSDAPQRIRVPTIDPVTVAPGETVTLDVMPEATANGVALVRARAVTAGGTAVGRAITIEITATNYGRVGWLIVLVSGAVVLGGTAWRILAVRREQAAKETNT